MLGSLYSALARLSWDTVPGHSTEFVNNANGEPLKITFLNGSNIAYVQYLTYDSNGAVIKIECKEE